MSKAQTWFRISSGVTAGPTRTPESVWRRISENANFWETKKLFLFLRTHCPHQCCRYFSAHRIVTEILGFFFELSTENRDLRFSGLLNRTELEINRKQEPTTLVLFEFYFVFVLWLLESVATSRFDLFQIREVTGFRKVEFKKFCLFWNFFKQKQCRRWNSQWRCYRSSWKQSLWNQCSFYWSIQFWNLFFLCFHSVVICIIFIPYLLESVATSKFDLFQIREVTGFRKFEFKYFLFLCFLSLVICINFVLYLFEAVTTKMIQMTVSWLFRKSCLLFACKNEAKLILI